MRQGERKEKTEDLHLTARQMQVLCNKENSLPIGKLNSWMFPGGCPPSIVSTSELNYRVRDGNGWTLIVIDTD